MCFLVYHVLSAAVLKDLPTRPSRVIMRKNRSAFALMTDMRPSGCLVKWSVIDCTFPGWCSQRGVTHRGCAELSHTCRCTRKKNVCHVFI